MRSSFRGGVLLTGIVIAGCETYDSRPPPRTTSDHAYANMADQTIRATQEERIWPTCPSPTGTGRCGTIVRGELSDAKVRHFVEKVCHEDPDAENLTDGCVQEFRDAFVQKLVKRYNRANPVVVKARCDESPDDCANLALLELQWLQSHNEGLSATLRRDLDRLETERQRDRATDARHAAQQAEDENRRRALAEGFRAMAAGFQAAGQAYSQNSGAAAYPPNSATYAPPSRGCASDFSCRYGQKCVKAEFKHEGICVDVVNEYGLKTLAEPSTDSVMVGGAGDCRFDTDCRGYISGFRCVKQGSSLTGHCMK